MSDAIQTPGAGGRFFLSYSRHDQTFALRLAADLRAAGAAIWIDQADIRPSERWDRAVETAVRECAGIVLVLSPRSAASDPVLDEVAAALDAGKPVIPVLIEPCPPPLRLTRVHYIDATGDYAAALARCRAAMAESVTVQSVMHQETPARTALLTDDRRAALIILLTEHMGPIAAHLIDEAQAAASSREDLIDRVAQRIADAKGRAAFLAAAGRLA